MRAHACSHHYRATQDYQRLLDAMRVPASVKPGRAGLWEIRKVTLADLRQQYGMQIGEVQSQLLPYDSMTMLARDTIATMHRGLGEVVMEDSPHELRRHYPILMQARGYVLVTGLGLGCVVRGLSSLPQVKHIDVIELDEHIINLVGPSFSDDRKVVIHHADALTFKVPDTVKWHYAWHDIWTEGNWHLDTLHLKLYQRYDPHVTVAQGAWQMNRPTKRAIVRSGRTFLGGPRA